MATKIQLRRDTSANWTSTNPVLAQGEIGIQTDTGTYKIGDGSTAWNSLLFPAEAPLAPTTILGTSASPAIGQTTYYNATSGNLTPTLPALSGLPTGVRLAVRRDPADASQNTVTLSCAGSDTFYSSGATSATFPLIGEQREFEVITVAGIKYWAAHGSVNPIAALDTRYLAGVSRLVNVVDSGYGTTQLATNSNVGTTRLPFTIGVTSNALRPIFSHFSTSASFLDTDPSTTISFTASLEIVSSSVTGTTAGTIIRLTFGGRTTATLDPGGTIVADPVGVTVAPGDVVAVRTYQVSGTFIGIRRFMASAFYGGYAGWAASSDLTAPGSGSVSIFTAGGDLFGPWGLLGQTEVGATARSFAVLGDSAASAWGDGAIYYRGDLEFGGWPIRAIQGKGGLLNLAVPGEAAANYQALAGSFRRAPYPARANIGIIEYGAKDVQSNNVTAAQLEAINLSIAVNLLHVGMSKVYLTTMVPRTTSTDGWATTTNQTPTSFEPQRVAYNTWVRAGCPIDPTTKTPVAVGTSGALLAGKTGHPVTGMIDITAAVESSLNSGLWAAAKRVATGSITSGQTTVTSSNANFNTAAIESGGDKGRSVVIPGAAASGGLFAQWFYSITNSTTALATAVAGTTVTNGPVVIGGSTEDGAHPSTDGHIAIAAALNVNTL